MFTAWQLPDEVDDAVQSIQELHVDDCYWMLRYG
jgi:hypothetical protein